MLTTHRPFFGPEELAALGRVLDSRWLGMGPCTREFERKLAEFLDVPYVFAVASGTAALHLSLLALSLKPGDEVILPSLTFPAAPQVILGVGAIPVFCEVCLDDLNMNMADMWRRVTPRTKAIMPMHYGGYACDLDALLPEARERQIAVVEDAAHAFGSSYHGRRIGSLSDLTCFSFDPIKNITCGGGGAIATGSPALAERIAPRRNLGIDHDSRSRHSGERASTAVVAPGYRYHMSDLNAAIGLEQLKRIAGFRARKQTIVRRYDSALGAIPGITLLRHDVEDSFPFSYAVRVGGARRDALMAHLAAHEIETLIQFTPNHLQPFFAPHRTALPATELLYGEILSLPLFYEMSDSDVDCVVDAIHAFMR